MSPVAAKLAPTLSSARTGAGKDDWCTPAVVLDRVRKVDPIGLDPCTSRDNPTGASTYYTGDPWDGLAESWNLGDNPYGLVYVNPPYSTCAAWVDKAIAESAFVSVILLVAARPDTKWWRRAWDAADAVAFWRGRLRFVGAPSCAPFPSALFALNLSQRRFKAAFGDVAEVVTP